MDAPSLFRKRVQEVQEEPRILGHRPGDVDEGDDRGVARRGRAIGEVDDGAAATQRPPEGAAQIDAPAAGICHEPPRHALVVRQMQVGDEALRLAISSAVICAKSLALRTSRSDTVNRAEISLSSFFSGVFCRCGAGASATRSAPGFGFSSALAPGAIGDICAMSFSNSERRRHKI